MGAALAVLPAYYSSPLARDNYKGIAAWLAATGNPATDLVVLDAPGQADAWAVYDPGVPVLALPAQRPADTDATQAALAAAVAGKQNVYALYWATDEADPSGIVEGWLDAHLFPAAEQWQGNVRLARYAQAPPLDCHNTEQSLGSVTLAELCTPSTPLVVEAGAPLVLGLNWQANRPLTQTLRASVQMLDARDQVVAQHDGAPGGDLRPSTSWQPGASIADNHALLVPPGTPPGEYRLVAALYDSTTGARLAGPQGDALELGTVRVDRADVPLPEELLPVQERVARTLGPVTLVGYDQYAKGFAHAPQTPLQAGDLLHMTLYWQAPDPLPAEWPSDLAFTLRLGDAQVSAPLAGGAYPTGEWSAGELVRTEFDIPYDGKARRATVEIAGERVQLAPFAR